MNQDQREEIRKEFQLIVKRRFNALNEITLEKLDLNPYVLRLLGLKSPREIAEFMISQRTERGIVTSYGTRIQKIARMFASGTGVEGADIVKEKNGKRHYVQMKAGPNTPNKDLIRMINKLLAGAVRRNAGSIPLLGMTYGKRARVSSIIQGYSDINWLIGREFWAFLSDDKNTAQELFDIASDVAEHYVPDGRESYGVRLEKKIAELAGQIEKKYGTGREMWKKLFDDNM